MSLPLSTKFLGLHKHPLAENRACYRLNKCCDQGLGDIGRLGRIVGTVYAIAVDFASVHTAASGNHYIACSAIN